MRINEQAQQILAAQGPKGPRALRGADAVRGAAGADAVQVSASGATLQKAASALSAMPDIRADLVADLKARIEAGTYQVSGRDVAGSILASVLSPEADG